jgi:outer membrane protein OmpA-like peptidoglycan-associated protein
MVQSKPPTYAGTWQGALIKAGQSMQKSTVVYMQIEFKDGKLKGHMREETLGTDYFALKQLRGSVTDGTLKFEQTVLEDDLTAFRSKWCLLKGTLNYDSLTGYLKGKFNSTDCSSMTGELILFRSDFQLSKEKQSHATHSWFKPFVKEFQAGFSAPEVRKKERENFVFEPIYFDFDKSEIREEHKDFLNRLIKVVKGHSDLRILVVGHTDAEGTNSYNDELSKRRAEAIVNYFVAQGLSKDRLKFDFKGESSPAATNETADGRQRNRRVDFEFIQH